MANKYDDMVKFAESINKPVTTVNICKAMAALGKMSNPWSILEPNAGMGEILYYCDYGVDIDAYSSNEEAIISGIDVDNRIKFIKENFLLANIDKKYDLIISQIPFSYGVHPITKKEEFRDLKYVDKILKLLNKDGVFVGLLPGRFLFDDYSLEMRKSILKNYSLEMIIELPYNKYKIKHHNISIVVIKKKAQKDNVLIVDYKENIDEIINQYVSNKGDGFISSTLLNKRWNKYYHSNKFNLLNSYKPSNFIQLDEIAEFIQGAFFSKATIQDTGDLMLIDNNNLVNGRIMPTINDKYILNDTLSPVDYILKDGDIIINIAMDGYCNVARYIDDNKPVAIQFPYIAIRSENQYFTEFMNTVSGLSFFEDYLNRHVVSSNKRINIKDIKKFKIPIFHLEDLGLIEKRYNNSLKGEDILSRLGNIKREIESSREKKRESDKRINELENKLALAKAEAAKVKEDKEIEVEKITQKLLQEKEYNKKHEENNRNSRENEALIEKMFKDEIKKLHKKFDDLENNIERVNETLHKVEGTVNRVEASVNKYGRLIEDIHSMITDIHGVQEDILERLKKATDEDEKEKIYVKLTEEILKVIDKNYDIKRSHNIDKVEEEYKIKFTEGGWNKLHNNTRRYLITAQVIYDDLKTSKQLDFSPVCIALTKALENELFIHLFDKMQRYFKKDKNTIIPNLPDGIIYYSNYQRSQFFSLGKLPFVLGIKFDPPTKHKEKQEKLKSLNRFLNSGVFKKDIFEDNKERDEYLEKLNKKVDIATRNYRNPAAHRDFLTITKAAECRNLIIDTKKILIEFINNLA